MYIVNNKLKFQQIQINSFWDIFAKRIQKKSKSHSEIIAVKVENRKILKIFTIFSRKANITSQKLTKLYVFY